MKSRLALTAAALLLSACAWRPTGVAPPGDEAVPALADPPTERVWLLTPDHRLLQVDAARPEALLRSCTLGGLREGEQLLGIDFRVARGVLYALGRSGQL